MSMAAYLTSGGLEVLNKVIAAQGALVFTKAELGSGVCYDEDECRARTALVNKVANATLVGARVEGGEAKITAQFINDGLTQGFFVNEIGFYVLDPTESNEVLYCYATFGDGTTPDWIAPVSSARYIRTYDVTTVVSDVENVTINASSSALVTREEFNTQLQTFDATLHAMVENALIEAQEIAEWEVEDPDPDSPIGQIITELEDVGDDITNIQTSIQTINTNVTNAGKSASSSDTNSKIFIIGATTQAASAQTYSHDEVYVGTDHCLYSNSKKVLTGPTVGSPASTYGTHALTGATQDSNGDIVFTKELIQTTLNISATLATGSWSSTTPPTQTITNSALSTAMMQHIAVGLNTDSITEIVFLEACDAMLACTDWDKTNGTVTITAFGGTPGANIPIVITMYNK